MHGNQSMVSIGYKKKRNDGLPCWDNDRRFFDESPGSLSTFFILLANGSFIFGFQEEIPFQLSSIT
jgi:hypothetical protein